jgi:hypothetical protein
MFSGKVHARSLDVTEHQMAQWLSGMVIQKAMPQLSQEDREFLISGMTPEEWMAMVTDLEAEEAAAQHAALEGE